MIFTSSSNGNPLFAISLRIQTPRKNQSWVRTGFIYCSQNHNPKNTIKSWPWNHKTQLLKPVVLSPEQTDPPKKARNMILFEEKHDTGQEGAWQMAVLSGFGYWVQGFRCFPWLALNFHMAHGLNMHPSVLQLVQNCGNLPMVAKPLYGILSDAIYVGGGRRIPYICIGVLLQVFSWGSLALIPAASQDLPALMACVLLSNVGASITEVAKDALVAEYGQKNKITGLQSYAFMASAAGGILGNLIGGFFLLRTKQPKSMFQAFVTLLAIQFAITSAIKEESLGLSKPSDITKSRKSINESLVKQYSNLMVAVREENIYRPLVWIFLSIMAVPILSGSIFCYQTQCLNLDPSVIGMSKVTGQLILLSVALLYDRLGKNIPVRKLIGIVQIMYAFSLLLDVVLVKQANLIVGIPNETFALCFLGLAETIAQFKLLPFQVLFASLAPPGCEGSLMSFLASALCLSSIFSGLLGIGLASLLGITSGDYSRLPLGIVIQFLAALLPLQWIDHVPISLLSDEKKKKGVSKRARRNRRVGRVVYGYIYSYRRERESDLER